MSAAVISHASVQQALPAGHGHHVTDVACAADVAVVSNPAQGLKPFGESGLGGCKLGIQLGKLQARSTHLDGRESLSALPMHFGLASGAHGALNDGQDSEHSACHCCHFGAAAEQADHSTTATRHADGSHQGIGAVVEALVEPVDQDGVLDVEHGLVMGARVGLIGNGLSDVGHVSLTGGVGGGGYRNGGVCDLPSRSTFSMGGPFVGVGGVGASTLSECDRPPYCSDGLALRLRATVITQAGERVKLNAIAPSRAAMDDLVAKAYPDARFVSTIVVREVATC